MTWARLVPISDLLAAGARLHALALWFSVLVFGRLLACL
jgi:hypothetical protein